MNRLFTRYMITGMAAMITGICIFCTACNHKDLDVYVETESYRNAADYTKNNYDLTLFHAALEYAGLLDTLKGEGPFTLFVPNNKAFNDMGIVRDADFARMNKDSLRSMLLYHILPKRLYREGIPDLTIDNRHANLLGKDLYLAYRVRYWNLTSTASPSHNMYVNGVNIPAATQNVVLANGVLHVIERVLKYSPTVQNILESKPEFSTFVMTLKHFGEWDRLAEAGPFTIFAPTNSAFEAKGLTPDAIQALSPSGYAKRLWRCYSIKNHVFISDAFMLRAQGVGVSASDWYSNPALKMSIDGDEAYSVGLKADDPYNPFVIVTNPPSGAENVIIRATSWGDGLLTDIKADNGVVHAVQGLLIYPEEAAN